MAWKKFKRRKSVSKNVFRSGSNWAWLHSKATVRKKAPRRRFSLIRFFLAKAKRWRNRYIRPDESPLIPRHLLAAPKRRKTRVLTLRAFQNLRALRKLGPYISFQISTAHASFWMRRFFNTLMLRGNWGQASRTMSSALWGLSQVLAEDPLLLVFEFFELYRYPFLAVQFQRGWSTQVRLVFLAWWRQYLLLLRWFARSFSATKVQVPTAVTVMRELLSIIVDPSTSRTVQRRAVVVSLSTQSRLALNYRWR